MNSMRLGALIVLLSLRPALAAEFTVDMIQFDYWAMPNPDPAGAEPYVGAIVDLLNEFERRSGHTTRRTLAPYARVELDLERGNIDFSVMAWGEARGAYANRGTALVPLHFGVRALKGIALKDYGSLKEITISASRGLKIDPRFDADVTLKKDFVRDYTTGVRKTALRRDSQAVAGSLLTINQIIRKTGVQDEFGETLVLNTTVLSVAYSKKAPQAALEGQVQAVFKSIADDGTAKRIVDKWFSE